MEDRIPNWEAITASEIWQREILPWLNRLYQDALEEGCPELPTSLGATLEQYHFWRGNAAAIRMVRDMPQAMIEVRRKQTEEENKDAIIRQQTDRERRSRFYR